MNELNTLLGKNNYSELDVKGMTYNCVQHFFCYTHVQLFEWFDTF